MTPQGKRGNPAAAARGGPAAARKRLAVLAVGALLIALFVIVAVAQGLGDPSVPEGAVAVVEDAPDGTITQDEFDQALTQTAAAQGLQEAPAPDDPQYQQFAEAATSDLLLARWVLGEAEERGIEISERQIDQQLETVKQQQFGSEKAFQKFLRDSGFTLDEARDRIKLQLVSDAIQMAVLPADPSISEDEVQAFYDENAQQFEQPETRDIRVVVTKTEAEANQALSDLGSDPSPKTWATVATKYSIDEATKSTGGLRQGVVAGQSEPALDEQAFAAAEGELVGPFKGDAGFYVIEVEKITPAATTSVDDASQQIEQTLVAARQQQLAQSFQEDFQAKWSARSFCAEAYRIGNCANAEPPPDPCTEEVAKSTGCDAPVASTKPIAPGTAGVFGGTAPTGLPQGPITPQPPATQQLPVSPGGVPGEVPPGTVPPGTAPPGEAPPGEAPPVPPGG